MVKAFGSVCPRCYAPCLKAPVHILYNTANENLQGDLHLFHFFRGMIWIQLSFYKLVNFYYSIALSHD